MAYRMGRRSSGSGVEIALLLVDAEQLGEAAGVAVELLQRGDGVGVLAVDVVDRAELRERVVDALDLVAEHAPQPKAERDGELVVDGLVRAGDRATGTRR